MAYVQRPNTKVRSLIRKSLNRLEPVITPSRSSDGGHHSKGMKGNIVTPEGILPSPSSSSKSLKKMKPNAAFNAYKPCVALHVRHGDLFFDDRGRSKIDRSLHNYMTYVKNITKAMSISTIFLASDNATLVSVAPYEHPEYLWTTQKRPIKYHKEMFDVNNEDDLQVELSHVLAELILATRCEAMVACYDSAFSELIFLVMCVNSRIGRCPPSIDLRNPFVIGHQT